jgi:hypothetical protein
MTNKDNRATLPPYPPIKSFSLEVIDPHNSANLLSLDVNLLTETGSEVSPFMATSNPWSEEGKHEVITEINSFSLLLIKASLGKKPTMIELGSGWALPSLVFRKMFPLGRNILLDSSLPNLTIGEVNFRNNHSMSYKNGTESFSYSSYWGSLFGDMDGAAIANPDGTAYPETDFISNTSYPTQKTPFQSLDFIKDIIEPENIDTIECLHMDLQGCEFPMLAYLNKHNYLKNKIKSLFIGTHHITSHHKAVQLLEANGFTILQEADRTEIVPVASWRGYNKDSRKAAEEFSQQTNSPIKEMIHEGETIFAVLASITRQFSDGHIFAYKT